MAKILIIEDERSVRQALKFEFEDDGYEVLHASDFPEALDTLNEIDCDVIITDVHLKEGDCLQLMNILEENEKDVPFVVMTAFPESELAIEVKSLLKDRFFEKPFLTPGITDKVNEIVKSKPGYSIGDIQYNSLREKHD